MTTKEIRLNKHPIGLAPLTPFQQKCIKNIYLEGNSEVLELDRRFLSEILIVEIFIWCFKMIYGRDIINDNNLGLFFHDLIVTRVVISKCRHNPSDLVVSIHGTVDGDVSHWFYGYASLVS